MMSPFSVSERLNISYYIVLSFLIALGHPQISTSYQLDHVCNASITGHLVCECHGDEERLAFGPGGVKLPANTTGLSVRNCSTVKMSEDLISKLDNFTVLVYDNIGTLYFAKDSFNIREIRVANVTQIYGNVLANLAHSRQLDTVVFSNCTFESWSGKNNRDFSARLLRFDNVAVSNVFSGALSVDLPVDGLMTFTNSSLNNIYPAGVRVSGGGGLVFSHCQFATIRTHGIEASTDAFIFVYNNVSHMLPYSLVVSARYVNISHNNFLGQFDADALRSVEIKHSYVFVNNTVMPVAGRDSLMVKVSRSVAIRRLLIADNRMTCSCRMQTWIMRDRHLWLNRLETSRCLHVRTLPENERCQVSAKKFFARKACTELYVCHQISSQSSPEGRTSLNQ